ncbi:hypothetical protein A9242_09050 [Streptococcus agalactiae serogroup III]|nr:hypothetical protein F5G76_04320 [Streptococcus agalactiae]KAA9060587.1 hypothetical protein F5G80_04480 [Streptococcus agalactiae]OIX60230.1 hypothetical protein A9242_09050 [Streptococcus agalactiae serogroup III]
MLRGEFGLLILYFFPLAKNLLPCIMRIELTATPNQMFLGAKIVNKSLKTPLSKVLSTLYNKGRAGSQSQPNIGGENSELKV